MAAGKPQQQGCEAAARVASTVRKQRGEKVFAQLSFSLLHSGWGPRLWAAAAHLRYHSLDTPSQACRDLVSYVSLDLVRWSLHQSAEPLLFLASTPLVVALPLLQERRRCRVWPLM